MPGTKQMSLIIRGCGAILSAGQTVLLARLMGPQSLGEYAAVLALTALLVVPAAAGLPAYLTREVAKSRVNSDWAVCRGLIFAANRVAVIVSVVAMILLFILLSIDLVPNLGIDVILLSCTIVPLLSADLIRAGAMRGLGSALTSQIPESILRPGFLLIGVSFMTVLGVEIGTREALLAFALAGVGSAVIGQAFLYRKLRRHPRNRVVITSTQVVRGSSGLAAFTGTQTLIANLDIIILSIAGFLVAAGIFKVALLGVVVLLFIFSALAVVSGRDFAAALALKDYALVTLISDRLVIQSTLATSAVGAIFLLAGNWAIPLIFGVEYSDAYYILLVLTFGHVLAIILGPSQEIVTLLESFSKPVSIYFFSVILVLIISFSLLGWDPGLAVAVGSAVGNVARRGLLTLHLRGSHGISVDLFSALRRSRHQPSTSVRR